MPYVSSRGRINRPSFCPLEVCLRTLALVILLVGGQLGATSQYYRCLDGLEKKDKEVLVSRNLDDDSVCYMVEYLEGEESTNSRGQG